MEANFCPECGKQLCDGWFEVVHHDESEKYIWLTNSTDVLFDVYIKNAYNERLFPHKIIVVPWVKYGTIVAQSGGGAKATKVIDDHTQSNLILEYGKNKFKFVITEDNRQS